MSRAVHAYVPTVRPGWSEGPGTICKGRCLKHRRGFSADLTAWQLWGISKDALMRMQARVLRGFGWGMVVIFYPVAPATAEVRDVPCRHTLVVEPWNGPVRILAATRASCTRDHSSSDHIHKAQPRHVATPQRPKPTWAHVLYTPGLTTAKHHMMNLM